MRKLGTDSGLLCTRCKVGRPRRQTRPYAPSRRQSVSARAASPETCAESCSAGSPQLWPARQRARFTSARHDGLDKGNPGDLQWPERSLKTTAMSMGTKELHECAISAQLLVW